MKNLVITLGLVLFTCAARAQSLEAALSGYESVPTETELLRGRTRPELEAALVALSADSTRPLFVRARAIALLGRFPSDATRARLEAVLDGGSEHPSLMLAAVRAASRFGAAISVRLHPYLSHLDVHLREAAVIALAHAGDRPALEARLVEESNPRIRTRIIEELSAP